MIVRFDNHVNIFSKCSYVWIFMIFILTTIVARATVILLLLFSNTIVEYLFEKNEKIKLFSFDFVLLLNKLFHNQISNSHKSKYIHLLQTAYMRTSIMLGWFV